MRPVVWKYLHSRWAIDVIVPLALSLLFGTILEAAYRLKISPLSFLETPALTVIFLFITLSLQQAVLRLIFDRSLVAYVTKTRDRHTVTKIFGAEILQRFLSDGFAPELVQGAESLPWMLQRLEDGEHPLPLVSYAMLLDKAAEMQPEILWGIWHFDVVPIDKVFKPSGEVIADYGPYFNTLDRIYARINHPEDKARLFVFSDRTSQDAIQKTEGWKTLCGYMKKWKLTEYRVWYDADFQGFRTTCPGETMDDLVYFGCGGIMSDKFLIGMRKGARLVGLRHASKAISDFHKLWESVGKHCDPVTLP